MAERFNLTAQIQLQAPSNTTQVVSQIKKQLKGISVDVQVKANTPQVAKLNKELQGVSKASDASAKSVGRMNNALGQSVKRFSIITIATGSFIALARAIKNGTSEAIAFEREIVKISQVTGNTISSLQSLSKEVTRLSTSLGASSSDLLNVSRILAQAGFTAQKTKQALEILAQTTLAATFDNIQDTTEGAIAVLRQFSAEARAAGGDVKFLAATLDAVNSVSKNFAVESGDLISVIRRVGGVFAATGGKVNELIALFTSVRSTTRESAETIATGLRTIFTRLQRTDTVDQLKELGIQLRDSQGQFVGAYEAVRRLSVGLSQLDPRDARFSDIVEELGGFRQVGKVIPLLQQFTVAQNALSVAQNASGSVARDAATAQLSLGVQVIKVKEEFSALIRQFTQGDAFQDIAKGALKLASAFIRVASSLENVLPLILKLMALKVGRSLAPGLGALLGGGGLRGKNQGGKIHAFARGGHVPGTGNRDTVPAMLQPGEFVIKKSSAKKLGASTLESMNNNRLAAGGRIKSLVSGFDDGDTFSVNVTPEGGTYSKGVRVSGYDAYETGNKPSYVSKEKWARISKFRRNKGLKEQFTPSKNGYKIPASAVVSGNMTAATAAAQATTKLKSMITVGSDVNDEIKTGGGFGRFLTKKRYAMPDRLTTGRYAPQELAKGGGISGSDTVPALLTPGEFVINKSSAQGIGYSNLNKMNQTGVKRFAAGGPVGVQRFSIGGGVGPGGGDNSGIIAAIKELTSVVNGEVAVALDVIKSYLKAANDALQAGKGTDLVSGDPKNPDVVSTAVDTGFAELSSDTMALGQVMERVNESVKNNTQELKSIAAILSQSTGVKPTEFAYEAMDSTGLETSGTVESYSSGQVEEMMRSQGYYVTQLNELSKDSTEMSESFGSGTKALDTLVKRLLEEAKATSESTESKEEATKASKKLNAAQLEQAKKTHQIQKQIKANKHGAGPAPTPTGGMAGSDVAQKAGSAMQSLAGAALGATFVIGGLIESSTSLTDEQKKTEQAFYNAGAASLAFSAQVIGMTIELGANIAKMVSSTAARMGEVAASKAVIAAKTREAGMSGLPDGGGGGVMGKAGKAAGPAMAALAASAVVASLATAYFAAKTAEAVQELENFKTKMQDVADKELDKIGSPTETASEAKFVEAQQDVVSADIGQMVEKDVGSFNSTLTSAAAGAAGIGVAMLSVGVTLGKFATAAQLLPGVGTVIGAALYGAAAAAIVAGAAFALFGASADEEAKKLAGVFTSAREASKQFSQVTFRSRKAVADFDQTMQRAKDAGLNATDTLSKLAGASGGLVSSFEEGGKGLEDATKARRDAQKKALDAGLITAGGVSKELGPDATDEQIDTLKSFEALSKQEEQARAEYNKLIQKMVAQESALRNQMSAALNETIQEVGQIDPAALMDFTGMDSISELGKRTDAVGKQFRDLDNAIKKAQAEFENIVNAEYAARIEEANSTTGTKAQQQAGRDLGAALREEADTKIARNAAQVEQEFANAAVASKEEAIARLENTIALRQQQKTINESNSVLRAFNDVLLGGTATAQNFAAIDDQTSVRAGSGGQFGAVQLDSSVLDLPFEQVSQTLLSKATDLANISVPNQTGAGNELVFDASPLAKNLEDARKVTEAIPGAFEGVKTGGVAGKKLGEAQEEVIKNIEEATGIDNLKTDTNFGPLIINQVEEILKNAKGEEVSSDAFQPIIDTLKNAAAPSAEALKAAIAVQNQYLSKLSKVNQAIIDAQQNFADAQANVVDVQARNADRIAEATGRPRSRQDQERDRTTAAEVRLGGTARMAGAKAGDTVATGKAARELTAEANRLRGLEQKVAQKGSAVDDVTGKTLTTADLADLGKSANEASAGALQAKKELERLSNQSGRASRAMDDLAKAQASRKQLAGMATEFAFGSDDTRKSMGKNLASTRMAIGSMQAGRGLEGATEEQRAGVSSVLDQLSDFEFDVGGGKTQTGRQIKAELAAQEVMRTTGDQRAADAIREKVAAGSPEEQAVQELKIIAAQEAAAAQQLATMHQAEIQALNDLKTATEKNFPEDITDALRNNQQTPDEQKQEAETDQRLDAELLAANTNLIKSQTTLKEATDKLTIAIQKEETAQENVQTAEASAESVNKGGAALLPDSAMTQGTIFGTELAEKAAGEDFRKNRNQFQSGLTLSDAPTIFNKPAKTKEELEKERVKPVNQGRRRRRGLSSGSMFTGWMGGPVYRNEGGGIFQSQGSDTVPAMLTPGEFVMRKSAVDKLGIGYMRQLNRGHIPGFKRGGLIGTGGVQYKQEGGQIGGGGGLMIDPSNLSDILQDFDSRFIAGLDGVISQLAGFTTSFQSLNDTFSNLSMQHTFSGDMTLAFNITNADAIKNAVADAVTPKIAEIISQELDVRLNKDFQAGAG